MLKQTYFAKGKILLFGEYFVLFGSQALAIPTKVGQHLEVQTKKSYDPKLIWESYDVHGKKWFDVEMELWHFDFEEEGLDEAMIKAYRTLQKLLGQVRRENPHFLREKEQINVKTQLGFPLQWGLGSSSSLIFNVAQWAKVNPFDLGARSFGGSGYDIACAQSNEPIVYKQDTKLFEREPECGEVTFNPPFKDKLYFAYLGQKEKTSEHLERIKKMELEISQETIENVNQMIQNVITCESLDEFEQYIRDYENLTQKDFLIPRTKDLYFSDYWGEIKSLGAWGGDFVLVTSSREESETRAYFANKGYTTFLPYEELVGKEYQNMKSLEMSKDKEHCEYALL